MKRHLITTSHIPLRKSSAFEVLSCSETGIEGKWEYADHQLCSSPVVGTLAKLQSFNSFVEIRTSAHSSLLHYSHFIAIQPYVSGFHLAIKEVMEVLRFHLSDAITQVP